MRQFDSVPPVSGRSVGISPADRLRPPPPVLDRARLLLLREEQLFRDPFGSDAPSER